MSDFASWSQKSRSGEIGQTFKVFLSICLTGPKGLHLLQVLSLPKLSDLSKGATHICNLLSKYKDFLPQGIKFESRTFFGQFKTDDLRYLKSGKSRSKLKDFNKCEFPSLLTGTGPIIFKTSCMPPHISS